MIANAGSPVYPLFKAQMLGTLNYIGLLYNYGAQHRLTRGRVMPVCPGYYQRQGNSRAVCQQMTFAPVFSRSVGLFPTVSSARGTLVIQPSRLTKSSLCR